MDISPIIENNNLQFRVWELIASSIIRVVTISNENFCCIQLLIDPRNRAEGISHVFNPWLFCRCRLLCCYCYVPFNLLFLDELPRTCLDWQTLASVFSMLSRATCYTTERARSNNFDYNWLRRNINIFFSYLIGLIVSDKTWVCDICEATVIIISNIRYRDDVRF